MIFYINLSIVLMSIGSLSVAITPAWSQERIVIGKRIVGGEPTDIKEHPWQVAVNVSIKGNTYLCGGSIIAQRWILTAAHCFNGFSAARGEVKAKAGVNDYLTSGNWLSADKVFIHPNYNDRTHENDLALVKLKTDPKGEIIPLAEAAATIPQGQPLEVTGWGVTDNGTPSQELRKATVPYVDNNTCNGPQAYNGSIQPGMMCAGYREGGIDSCQGDSGGPLVLKSADGAILVGVVSFGDGCAKKLKYGVYTRVSTYRDWITETILASPR